MLKVKDSHLKLEKGHHRPIHHHHRVTIINIKLFNTSAWNSIALISSARYKQHWVNNYCWMVQDWRWLEETRQATGEAKEWPRHLCSIFPAPSAGFAYDFRQLFVSPLTSVRPRKVLCVDDRLRNIQIRFRKLPHFIAITINYFPLNIFLASLTNVFPLWLARLQLKLLSRALVTLTPPFLHAAALAGTNFYNFILLFVPSGA